MATAPKTIALSAAKDYAKRLAPALKGGETLALVGPLGSGKTTFTQALGKALGINQKILSPTFIVMQEFVTRVKTKNSKPVYLLHLDLYRTKNFREVKALGLADAWTNPQVITVIEWADKIRGKLPKNTLYINLYRDIT